MGGRNQQDVLEMIADKMRQMADDTWHPLRDGELVCVDVDKIIGRGIMHTPSGNTGTL